ncbi:MAG TPA: DUF885 domain-containing protein [Verrucomicrobiae bacterium]|nr:DUF885 domain-containing protein [Verrucomicrobiae bacterium]
MPKKISIFLTGLCSIGSLALGQPTATPAAADQAGESKRANEFLDKCFDEYVATHPQIESSLGIKTHNDQWNDISDEAAKRDLETSQKNLAELKRQFPKEKLDKQTQLSCDLFEFQVQREAEGFKFRFDSYPVNQMFGVHSEIPTFLINIHKIDNQKDAQAYLARLNGIPKLFDQLIVNLKEREEHGVIPPRFVFPLVLEACANVTKGQPFEESGPVSPLLEDFTKQVSAVQELDAATRDGLIAEARKALTESVKPSYAKLVGALQALEKKANDDAGVWKFPDGAQFYEFALRRTTTTNLTAEQIHETGLKEVARIHGEMRKIMEKVKFKGDLQAFFKFMREDPQFYLPQTEEGQQKYLAMATKIIDEMKKRLDELFLTKPKADIVVKAVEKFRESSAGKAFYNQPAPDGSRPGMFYVNLSNMKDNPTYELESLAHHEGIPGHHMQIAIAQELQGIPKFRKFGSRYTAYSEGWGLYSELTPKEIGMYQDPYSDFGRLSLELWRAGRLVVDTGLHAKKWTRQQAIDYLKQNTPNAETDCIDSINRYIVMPSQATAYKIGMLRIQDLREKAKKQLGAKFDLRQFHDVVLTNGPLPLDMLEQLVDAWVKSKSSGH